MRKILIASILIMSALLARAENRECSICVGLVSVPAENIAAGFPHLIRLPVSELDQLAPLPANIRARSVLVIEYVPAPDLQLEEIDRQLRSAARRIAEGGPLQAAGFVAPEDVPETFAWAARRFSVILQSERAASRSLVAPESIIALDDLVADNAVPYFDIIVVDSIPVDEAMLWTVEHDPSKRIHAIINPEQPNPLFDAARALASGATVAYLPQGLASPAAVAGIDSLFTGDWAADSTSDVSMLTPAGQADLNQPTVTFVRGEDLATIVVPAGSTDRATIVSVNARDLSNPRILRETITKATDVGERGERLLVGVSPPDQPFAVIFDRPRIDDPSIQKEQVDVAGTRKTPVEEIVRAHQAYWDFQRENQPPYIADNKTSLRFSVGTAGDVVESTIEGPHFISDRANDWVWQELFINGVRWKYGKIPELPLIQPEKVTQLPLEIHLSREYRYELVRETERNGYQTWEVAFEPPIDAPEDLPLYKGRVWIDRKTSARVAISMIQLNLSGDVLSNEETIRYAPFERSTWRMLTVGESLALDSREILWLPLRIEAQQTFSAAGRSTPVLRETIFSRFEIDPPGFEARRLEAHHSSFRMVRETDRGLRYLEPGEGEERAVQEGIDSSRLFLVGGMQYDEGLEYGVLPLGGINYFNYDLFDGLQTNIFFAGVILAANLTDPSFMDTRINLGADVFALAIPFENSMYRGGVEIEDEAVEAHPFSLSLRAGHPIGTFGKIDASLGISQISFGRADTTAEDFVIPSDTLVLSPGLNARYDRWGWSIATFYEHNTRTDWEPWGLASEFSEDQKEFDKYGASVSKSFHLPNFQRFSVGVEWVSGNDLDRFSKYSIDFWGSTRVRGFSSQSIRAEEGWFAHLSHGLVISEQFRVEAFYDAAMLDDGAAGFDGEMFQGLGLAGQTIGPWGTLLRFDLGKSVGDNAQDDIVASVVFLKLFD